MACWLDQITAIGANIVAPVRWSIRTGGVSIAATIRSNDQIRKSPPPEPAVTWNQ